MHGFWVPNNVKEHRHIGRPPVLTFYFSSIQNTHHKVTTHAQTHTHAPLRNHLKEEKTKIAHHLPWKLMISNETMSDNNRQQNIKTSLATIYRRLSIFALLLIPFYLFYCCTAATRSAWSTRFEWKSRMNFRMKKSPKINVRRANEIAYDCISHGFITRSHTHFHKSIGLATAVQWKQQRRRRKKRNNMREAVSSRLN